MNRFKKNVFWVFLLLFALILFYPIWSEGKIFAERDIFSFYYPLFQRIQDYWREGHFPLWDPCENLGQPLFANLTSSVLYPGKLIFALPLSYDQCFNLYVVFHFLLCGISMYALMRHWRFSRTGSLLAAISFSYCGPVFMQYSNVIYLVGISWFPLAILFGSDLVLRRKPRSLAALAGALVMMVFGGDIQTAWFAGILLCFLTLIYWRCGLLPKYEEPNESRWKKGIRSPLGLLIGSALLASVIGGIQVFPAMELSKYSERNWFFTPISIWDTPKFLMNRNQEKRSELFDQFGFTPSEESAMDTILNGIFCKNIRLGGYHASVYDYSMYPTQIAELLTPFPFGFKENRIVLRSAGESPRRWNQTLYMGIIPFLLGLSALCFRLKKRIVPDRIAKSLPLSSSSGSTKRKRGNLPKNETEKPISSERISIRSSHRRAIQVWASWIIIVCLLASLGFHGPRWFQRLSVHLIGSPQDMNMNDGDPVGGIYWLINVFVPLASSFRYAGKYLMPVFFALPLLAGLAWDYLRTRKSVKILCFTAWGILIIAFLSISGIQLESFNSAFLSHPDDTYQYGTASKACILSSIGFSCAILSIWIVLFYLPGIREVFQKKQIRNKGLFACVCAILLILAAADLYLADSKLLFAVSPKTVHDPVLFAEKIQKDQETKKNAISYPRYYRYAWSSRAFFFFTPGQQEQRSSWSRKTLDAKFQYQFGLANMDSPGTLSILEYFLFADALYTVRDNPAIVDRLAWLNTEYMIYPSDPERSWFPPEIQTLNFDPAKVRTLYSGNQNSPSAWEETEYPIGSSLYAIQKPGDRIRIFHDTPELTDSRISLEKMIQTEKNGNPKEGESVKITHYEANRIEFEADLVEKGTILLTEQYFPGWKAQITGREGSAPDWKSLPIKKSLGILRAVDLDPGKYTVRMIYSPAPFKLGILFTLIGLGGAVFILRKKSV
ncbi:MAG: hypothetical protein Q4G69_05420 [Planctomycetia bacterium]|nr:hypothetical protein [Planctomycetia bacterium]